jgi:hypothetical protein
MSSARQQVAVVVGATSKWQSDGRNTKLAHGKVLDDSEIPVGMRWGVGGAIYPRVMMRTLAQVLTEEYSEHGVHVANVVIDGLIDSPGTRALPRAQKNPEIVMNPVKIAEAFYYLHTQDRSCWTHELQLTPFATKPSF